MKEAGQVDITRALSILGWMSDKELIWLASRAQEFGGVIVEFGSFRGRSTRALADHIKPNGTVFAVDPWNGDYILEDTGESISNINTFVMPQFVENLKDHIQVGRVVPVRAFSDTFKLPDNMQADMVFIDGDHGYKACKKDILRAIDLLKNNGLLCGHDYHHPNYPGVAQAVKELVGRVEVEDSIWWTLL